MTGTLCWTLPAPHAKMCSKSPRKVCLFTDVILQNLHRERQNFPTLFKCHTDASSRVLRCSEDKEFSLYITLRSRTRCRPKSRSKFICGEAAGTLNYIRILHAPSFFSPGSQGLMCDSNSAGGEKHQTCQLMHYTSLNKDSDLNITDG